MFLKCQLSVSETKEVFPKKLQRTSNKEKKKKKEIKIFIMATKKIITIKKVTS